MGFASVHNVVDDMNNSKTYTRPFKIKLDQKEMILCAKSDGERNMWISVFNYAYECQRLNQLLQFRKEMKLELHPFSA